MLTTSYNEIWRLWKWNSRNHFPAELIMSQLSLIITISQQIPTLWLMRWTIELILIITPRISHPQDTWTLQPSHTSGSFVCHLAVCVCVYVFVQLKHRHQGEPHGQSATKRTTSWCWPYQDISFHRDPLAVGSCVKLYGDRPGSSSVTSTRIVKHLDCCSMLQDWLCWNSLRNSLT